MTKMIYLLSLMLLNCGCSLARNQVLAQEADLRRDMVDSTVMLRMDVYVEEGGFAGTLKQILMGKGANQKVLHMSCSGVVVDKAGGIVSEPKTLIVTAHHCLDLPKVGDAMGEDIVSKVEVKAYDSRGTACELTTIALGGYGPDDTATAVGKCDIGKVGRLATHVPATQEQVYISGHPSSIFPAHVSMGYLSGWLNGWLLTSAPAWPGSSGGPVWNTDGELIGLLVRGSQEYPLITLVAPLGEIQKRLKQSETWSD